MENGMEKREECILRLNFRSSTVDAAVQLPVIIMVAIKQ